MLKALMHFLICRVLEQNVTLAKCAEGGQNVCPHKPARTSIKDDISLWIQEIIRGIRKYSEEQGGDVRNGGGGGGEKNKNFSHKKIKKKKNQKKI